jgi:hypothetical protein
MQTGGWSQLIVGHQWPSEMTISGLHAWIENRGQIANAHHNIADLLNAAKTGPLSVQEGKTADAIVQLFGEGEQLARGVAKKNDLKKDSYTSALASVHNLREKLTDIADRYNQEINKILESKEPAAVKVPHVLEAISRGQQEANLAAANCGGDIGDAAQRILDQEGADQSFRQFAHANGIDVSQLFRSRDVKGLESTVHGMLSGQDGLTHGAGAGAGAGAGVVPAVSPASSGLSGGATGGAAGGSIGAVPAANPATSGGFASGSGVGSTAPMGVSPASAGLSGAATGGKAGGLGGIATGVSPAASGGSVVRPAGFSTTTPGFSPPTAPAPTAPAPSPTGPPNPSLATPTGVGGGPAPSAPSPGSSLTTPAGFGGGHAPSAPSPGSSLATPANFGAQTGPISPAPSAPGSSVTAPPPMFSPAASGFGSGASSGPPGMPFGGGGFQGAPPPSFSPGEFMHHGDGGFGPGGAGAVPPAAPITPQAAPTPVSPQTAPTAGSGDWHSPVPQQPSVPQASAPSYSTQAASPMMSTPSATNASYAPSAPSGALPGYGTDLRPPTPSVPAGSPSLPPPLANSSPAPGSPTTNPAAGSGGVTANAAAARPVPMASLQQPAPVGIAGKAVAAAAGGAVAGAVSADATARIRLQRIVDAVARQEPRLAWAAGDRPDDTTVLITDLAGGWIPPGIDIPAAVTLLEPGRRRGDLVALLGEVKLAVTHTPDRYVPEADEPVPTSPRPRHAPEIEELGWELGSATRFRDGLPRMAHTLAKAASSGTGVDGPEVEELHQYLDAIGERVLEAYPDEVDPNEVGNWQLLAAIEALVRGDRTAANYHLAWFQASMASVSGQQR